MRIARPKPKSKKKPTLGKHGGDRKSGKARACQGNNVTVIRGNNPAYILARLQRDRPDLAGLVESGELSAHAAAIEAGFRKKATSLDKLRLPWEKAECSGARR